QPALWWTAANQIFLSPSRFSQLSTINDQLALFSIFRLPSPIFCALTSDLSILSLVTRPLSLRLPNGHHRHGRKPLALSGKKHARRGIGRVVRRLRRRLRRSSFRLP